MLRESGYRLCRSGSGVRLTLRQATTAVRRSSVCSGLLADDLQKIFRSLSINRTSRSDTEFPGFRPECDDGLPRWAPSQRVSRTARRHSVCRSHSGVASCFPTPCAPGRLEHRRGQLCLHRRTCGTSDNAITLEATICPMTSVLLLSHFEVP